MIGMSSSPFSSSLEIRFNDCPLVDKYRAFSPEKTDIVALDKPIAKNPEAVRNFAAVTEISPSGKHLLINVYRHPFQKPFWKG